MLLPRGLIYDTGFMFFCTAVLVLCMFYILHLIQKHIVDSRGLSYLNCCEGRLLDKLNYFTAKNIT